MSLDRDRRTSGPASHSAVRSAMARAREIGATSVAFPALGTGVGGFPLDEAARITVGDRPRRADRQPAIDHVIFALRGADAYEAFGGALPAWQPRRSRRCAPRELPYSAIEEQRDELVEQVAREIQLRGLTGPAVHFLEASRPYGPLGANAMLFFDPVLHGVFGGDVASVSEILADETASSSSSRGWRSRRRDRLGRLTEPDGPLPEPVAALSG